MTVCLSVLPSMVAGKLLLWIVHGLHLDVLPVAQAPPSHAASPALIPSIISHKTKMAYLANIFDAFVYLSGVISTYFELFMGKCVSYVTILRCKRCVMALHSIDILVPIRSTIVIVLEKRLT